MNKNIRKTSIKSVDNKEIIVINYPSTIQIKNQK